MAEIVCLAGRPGDEAPPRVTLTATLLHRAIANALHALGHGDAYVVTGRRRDRAQADFDITIKLGDEA